MKPSFKRNLARVLVLVALLPILVMAASAKPTYPTSMTVYMSSADYGYCSIPVTNLTSSQKVSSVSSSTKSVAVYSGMNYNSHEYINASDSAYNSSSKQCSISLSLKKPGTSTISFKVGSTTYKTKLTVKKYVNPVKTLTITGVNSGNNMASKFKSYDYYSTKVPAKVSSAKLVVKPVTGWVITNISFYKSSSSTSSDGYYYWAKGTTSATVSLGALAAKQQGYINVTMKNTTTNGTITACVQLGS